MAEITNITGVPNIGVRMHWLYFDDHSPLALEKAGFSYDSTVGYNQTIGYRAGTAQVYKPLQAHHLLELPLHIMDTALLSGDYLNLTFEEADRRIGEIIDYAGSIGGAVTFNWHDRSIAPERLWGEFYAGLISELKRKGAWRSSAGTVVSWFQKRRSVVFEQADQRLRVAAWEFPFIPTGMSLGSGCGSTTPKEAAKKSSEPYVDISLSGNMTIRIDRHSFATHN